MTLPTSWDYRPAVAHLRHSAPCWAALIERIGPCTLAEDLQTGDLLACLTEAILSQQLSSKAAATIHARLLAHYGGRPLTAQAIFHTPDEVLRAVGLSRPKVGYLKDLAQRVEQGLPSLESLATWEDERIIQTLTAIRGVGRWTVEMLLIFRLHRPDVWPVDDLGLRTALQRLLALPERPSPCQAQDLGRPWQPYRTLAAWYLWRSLDLPT
ncbi:MAG: DNA-3-methyladenine glycosylase 2 family protein [Gloeomargaritaceae cyanobacterium C42_A2020_066]|nr:DNA-3-methyladenine glycosylase 2 family protein [Gloeomargaritaceae cyanobacterium C42_A2020_066]